MNTIVAVDENYGIGCKGRLLQSIPEDMKFFKEMTIGKVVIMGRETFESLPGKKPLMNRVNIVLTKNLDFKVEGVIILNSIEDVLEQIKRYNQDEVFVIGGGSIYKQLLHYSKKCYLTKIYSIYESDTYFPNIESDESWKLKNCSEIKTYNNLKFRFLEFENYKCLHF